MYTAQEQKFLLTIARTTLELITDQGRFNPARSAPNLRSINVDLRDLPLALQEPRACFVTLETRPEGHLRGCTGTLMPRYPLAEEVVYSTHHTAFYDPRFPPVLAAEVPYLRIELSILTLPQPLDYTSPQELVKKLRPGVHGVTLSLGNYRATFLPQVWEKFSIAEDFLEALCHKMGLASDAWESGKMDVEIYEALKFVES